MNTFYETDKGKMACKNIYLLIRQYGIYFEDISIEP